MNGSRVEAIDAIRGITIFMMILCAAIGPRSGLPAWMFHCQVPPPDYVFRPEVRGITWVDLVFPFFIFAMGAAIPFWLGGKLDRGESLARISMLIAKRSVVLLGFSLVLGHASAIWSTGCPEMLAGAVRTVLWLCLFAALVRTRRKWVNAAGWIAIAAVFLWMHFAYGLEFSFRRDDRIITLLSIVSLLGGFIWLATRNSSRLRTLALLLVIVAKILGISVTQYLVIALPASIAGDLLRGTFSGADNLPEPVLRRPEHFAVPALIAFAAAIVQLWGLYTRNVTADLCITAVFGTAFLVLSRKSRGTAAQIGLMGFAMLIAGIACDYLDGGIAKDHCNLSYLLVTGGQTALTLVFLLWVERRSPLCRMLVLSGQNPMMAYTVGWYVICPVLVLTGLQGWYDGVCSGPHPWLGLLRGLVIALLTVSVTCIFTRHKIFWRS